MALTLMERLAKLRTKLSSVNNLNSDKTAGDMKFYIFDYEPRYELRVRSEIEKAVKVNPEIVQFDLYRMMLEIIEESGYFETIKNMEQEYDKALLLQEVFKPMLALEKTGNIMLEKFANSVEDDGQHIVLITGVGKSFPVIRSHTILNNLQSIFKKNPVVMIYPGKFSVRRGHLKLFDVLDDDNYYRAFSIIERKED